MKKLQLVLLATLIMLMFTACCTSHEWQEATCSTPKTCTKCGETEGEPLEHDLTEANYQQGPVCKVCGEEVGEPLEAYAEKKGIVFNTELNVPYDYIARCSEIDENTTAKVVFTDYKVFSGDETHEALEGYEWRSVTATVTFYADENVSKYGFKISRNIGEYYLEDNKFNNETKEFTVNYLGKDYSECKFDSVRTASDWMSNHTRVITDVYYIRVPIGFDGMYVYYYNTLFNEEERIPNSVYFRLNKDAESANNKEI